VPLVLVDGDYEPWTDHPVPTGKIVWVNVVEEQALVASLHELGLVKLLESS